MITATSFEEWFSKLEAAATREQDLINIRDVQEVMEIAFNTCLRLNAKPLLDECKRLYTEVQALRMYGNKDCTAMADDFLAANGVQSSIV